MKKVCMNYNQFMAAFKSAESGYSKKANTANKDAKIGTGITASTSTGPIKGANTTTISKFTKDHLSNVKSKTSVRRVGTKK